MSAAIGWTSITCHTDAALGACRRPNGWTSGELSRAEPAAPPATFPLEEAVAAMFGDTFAVTVEVDAGPSGQILPRRFRLGAREIEVADVLDRWPGADHLHVKLRGVYGAPYIPHQELERSDWRLVLFRAPGPAG